MRLVGKTVNDRSWTLPSRRFCAVDGFAHKPSVEFGRNDRL
jgi:hypothetical protein